MFSTPRRLRQMPLPSQRHMSCSICINALHRISDISDSCESQLSPSPRYGLNYATFNPDANPHAEEYMECFGRSDSYPAKTQTTAAYIAKLDSISQKQYTTPDNFGKLLGALQINSTADFNAVNAKLRVEYQLWSEASQRLGVHWEIPWISA